MVKKSQSKKRPVPSNKPRNTNITGAGKKEPLRKKKTPKKITTTTTETATETRRKTKLKALEFYERALKTLQRRNFRLAATRFEMVIRNFPVEYELHERSRRYLDACQRHLIPIHAPETIEERVYAATLALNSGSGQEALQLLNTALTEAPDNEHIHYMLAIAHTATEDKSAAVTHLHRAIELNPDNRLLAQHEPNFEALHDHETFQQMLASTPNGEDESHVTRQRRAQT